MKCKEYKSLIAGATLGGVLTPHETELLEKHLAKCPACAAEYSEMMMIVADARQNPEPPQPDDREWLDFERTLMRRIRTQDIGKPVRTQWAPLKWVVPTALAVIAVVLILHHSFENPIETSDPIPPEVVQEDVNRALIKEYIVEQLDLEELYLSEESVDQQVDELAWYL